MSELLGGKMMDGINYAGKVYLLEEDVRRTVNAALATNKKYQDENAALRKALLKMIVWAEDLDDSSCVQSQFDAELKTDIAAAKALTEGK